EKLRSMHLDFVLSCGSEPLSGDIVGAARLGVIALPWFDNSTHPLGTAGFWECYYGLPQTAITIEHIGAEVGKPIVLFHGAFATRFSFALNQAELFAKSILYLKD